jgi:hypothetical protein
MIYTQPCPRPILRQPPKPVNQLSLLPNPQPPTQHREPPTVHREPPTPERAKITRNPPDRGQKLPIREAIDYDKLTVNEQMKWDAGIYGSVQLRSDVKSPYYFVRWKCPITKKHRSLKLDEDYDRALEKRRQLTAT